MECFANNRLRLSITNVCNFKCRYCSNEGQSYDSKVFLDINLLKHIFNKVKEENIYIRKLNITGGEPLLHRNIVDIIKLSVNYSDMVTLNTNGSLLNKNLIKEFADIGLHNIKFGIDTFFSNQTKFTVGHVKSKLKDTIIENIHYAREVMPRSSINLVLTDFNKDEIPRILNYIIEKGIDKVELLELISHDFKHTGESLNFNYIHKVLLSLKHLFSIIRYNEKLAKYICYTKTGIAVQFAEDFCKSRVCQDLWTRINSHGELLPCIKEGKGIKIDFSEPLSQQIIKSNFLMCCGRDGIVFRDNNGNISGRCNYYKKQELADDSFEFSNEDL